jgi:hypothetical protein
MNRLTMLRRKRLLSRSAFFLKMHWALFSFMVLVDCISHQSLDWLSGVIISAAGIVCLTALLFTRGKLPWLGLLGCLAVAALLGLLGRTFTPAALLTLSLLKTHDLIVTFAVIRRRSLRGNRIS